jgi:hypothetical protein
VKHVFVETNFVINVLRPFPMPTAERLLSRHGSDVELYLPWCSVNEAKRTLDRIIKEDLGFIDGAGKFFRRIMARYGAASPVTPAAVNAFIVLARDERRSAIFEFEVRVDALAAGLTVIPPSAAVVQRTLGLFPIKSLPPSTRWCSARSWSRQRRCMRLGSARSSSATLGSSRKTSWPASRTARR